MRFRLLGGLGKNSSVLGAKPLPNLLGKSLDMAPLGMPKGLGSIKGSGGGGGIASSLDSLPTVRVSQGGRDGRREGR